MSFLCIYNAGKKYISVSNLITQDQKHGFDNRAHSQETID